MKPIDQTQFYDEEKGTSGDCWRACLASILELDITSVPHFVAEDRAGGGHWFFETEKWLARRNLWIFEKHLSDGTGWIGPIIEGKSGIGYFILNGKSPRGEHLHSVVAQGGNMVHDPHPSRAGLDGPPTAVTIFVALNPALVSWEVPS